MKKILIINGPNLNLLGVREKSIYGAQDFESYFSTLKAAYESVALSYYQSNTEGFIIDKIHEVGFDFDGIILNAGAYTHTSVAIGDAIAAVNTAVVEIHISNVHTREEFRHHSFLAKNCVGVICGFGLDSYRLGLEALLARS
ncbi:type II 3-dehydroquinate dehydratase [Sphingobacterium sp. SRCM116780]|uniref:type II 3-dehydroquinate dehydratase n=1 Tax=Sphingobacterium sp. SRCM116780 TaxID=2907623 RepID=UPI001F2A544A|nr:type II 3-dehydroquinate dehydratase [Sphingobacterium sp. SRCM116780]UIR56828.1 type II 3-dehydroquinate dehydratase [Sphingobacterium sp. SRCM116780]